MLSNVWDEIIYPWIQSRIEIVSKLVIPTDSGCE